MFSIDFDGLFKPDRVNTPNRFAQCPLASDRAQLFGGFKQFLAEIRMGDVDEPEGPLADRLAVKVDGPELGDDVAHVAAARDDAVVRGLREHVPEICDPLAAMGDEMWAAASNVVWSRQSWRAMATKSGWIE